MSRKDYRAMAEVISQVEKTPEVITITKELARVFKRDNPNFQFSTFYSACGLEGY